MRASSGMMMTGNKMQSRRDLVRELYLIPRTVDGSATPPVYCTRLKGREVAPRHDVDKCHLCIQVVR